MPVHNALPYLDEAIESILGQSFSNFEFVILDDASKDGSTERLQEWASKDNRIRLMRVEENLGPARSSDRVARAASAPVVARMDADDISHPDRLRQQLDLLRGNPDVGVVGSLCDLVDGEGRRIRGPEYWRLARRSWMVPFPHGALMYRRAIFDQIGGYRRECPFWEDQDLILRMAGVTNVAVIPRPLLRVRQTSTSVRAASDERSKEEALDTMYRAIERLERNLSYDDVLQTAPRPGDKVDPRVFIATGSVTLWSGNRPRLFGRLLERGKLRADFRSLSVLAWTAWASASPGTLRKFLSFLHSVRNLSGMKALSRRDTFLWSPPARPDRRRE